METKGIHGNMSIVAAWKMNLKGVKLSWQNFISLSVEVSELLRTNPKEGGGGAESPSPV